MKSALALAGALSIAAAPLAASAQPPAAAWRGDICHQHKRAAGAQGTLFGSLLGGLFGSAIAGRSHRVAGAAVGGSVEAAAGHTIGLSTVACLAYPPRITAHEVNCRWVEQAYDGAEHAFEACRGPDGVRRPSGRS